jgi:hypothetical protein
MQAVFDRSWRMMTPEQQAVMARLSVFRGGFTREAAEEVTGANLRILLALVNKSLLQRHPAGGRFTIHELLRQYAAMRRRADDPVQETELAHCRAFARLVQVELAKLREIAPVSLSPRLASDADNLQRAWNTAIARGLVEEAADLAGGLYALANVQGLQAERLYEDALQSLAMQGIPETHPAMLRLRLLALVWFGGLSEIDRVKQACLAFIPLAEAHADPITLFQLYLMVAALYRAEKEPEALRWLDKAARLATTRQDELDQRGVAVYEAITRIALGQADEAVRQRLEALMTELAAMPAPQRWRFEGVMTLRDDALARGDYETARRYSLHLTDIGKGAHNLYAISVGVNGLVDMALRTGQRATAARQLLDVLDWHLAIGKRWQTVGFLYSVVDLFTPLFGDETAAAILSMAYHHPEAIALYRANINAARRRLEAAMGAAPFAAAWERGQTLAYDTAVAQVRSILTAASPKSS